MCRLVSSRGGNIRIWMMILQEEYVVTSEVVVTDVVRICNQTYN